MDCARTDKHMFPGCCDVVRVGSDRWTQHHTDLLDAISTGVTHFLERNSHLSFDELNNTYGMHEPQANVGGSTVFILYGTPTPFFRDGDDLNMDIRGLVLRPRARRHKGTLTVEL